MPRNNFEIIIMGFMSLYFCEKDVIDSLFNDTYEM